MARNNREPLFSIRIAARLVGLHVQTLRYYERSGLIKPQRSSGNVRYYSEQDVEMIRRIKSLVDDLGVNLAGVEVIMRMNERMAQMEAHIRILEQRLAEVTGRRYLSEATGGDGRERQDSDTQDDTDARQRAHRGPQGRQGG